MSCRVRCHNGFVGCGRLRTKRMRSKSKHKPRQRQGVVPKTSLSANFRLEPKATGSPLTSTANPSWHACQTSLSIGLPVPRACFGWQWRVLAGEILLRWNRTILMLLSFKKSTLHGWLGVLLLSLLLNHVFCHQFGGASGSDLGNPAR